MPGATPRLIRQLRSGTADLGLLTLPVDDPALTSVPVMREELLLVTAPQHPLARKKHITPQDLARQPFGSSRPDPAPQGDRRVLSRRAHHADGRDRDGERRDHQGAGADRDGHHDHSVSGGGARSAAGALFCARIAGQQLVRETGWVHLKLNRVPRPVQEMMKTFERIRSGLKLSPGVPARRAARPATPAPPAESDD